MRRGANQTLSLTRERIAACHRGPAPAEGPSRPELSVAEIDRYREAALATVGDGGLWLFAYGSLMWQPEVPVAERRLATVRGYHRRFCLWQWRHRGSEDRPNLMLAIDSRGSCSGVAYRIAAPGGCDKLAALWRREMVGDGYRPRWVTAMTGAGPVRAIAFAINRDCGRYAGWLDDEVVASYIAAARGRAGTGAKYLLDAVTTLERLGLRDGMLWRMQRLVAGRLEAGVAIRAADRVSGRQNS